MSNNVMCEDCAHSVVCKYREGFVEIQKQFNSFKVGMDTDKQLTVKPIKSFNYVEVPRLECNDFLDRVYACKRSI